MAGGGVRTARDCQRLSAPLPMDAASSCERGMLEKGDEGVHDTAMLLYSMLTRARR
jgi:hypothetical protein